MAELDDRLAAAGLAVPGQVRASVNEAVRQVRGAGLLVLASGVVAIALQPAGSTPIAGWFVLPLIMIAGCLGIARMEIREYTQWATYAGRERLAGLWVPRARRGRDGGGVDDSHGAGEGDGDGTPGEQPLLTALAVRGPTALADADLRAALSK
jgi:hypothetical protein